MRDKNWPDLTTKQADFVRAFLANGGNATEAARQAGYSENTAMSIGHENLSKPKIMSIIEAEREKHARSAEMTVEEVARRLAWLARSDPADFYHVSESGVRLKDMDELTEAQRYCLRSAGQTVTQHGGSIKVTLADPKPALDTLANWLGMMTKKVEVSNPDGSLRGDDVMDLSKLTEAELLQLAELRKKMHGGDDGD